MSSLFNLLQKTGKPLVKIVKGTKVCEKGLVCLLMQNTITRHAEYRIGIDKLSTIRYAHVNFGVTNIRYILGSGNVYWIGNSKITLEFRNVQSRMHYEI